MTRAKKSSKVFYLVQQRSCFDEISRVQALGEGAIDRHQQIACRLVATALEAEPRLTRGRAQLAERRRLTARNIDRRIEIGGRGIGVATLGEHDHAADAVQLCLIEALVKRLD